MGFIAVCTALYDYQPQSEAELEFSEGELLYILDKSGDDDWWRAKKKAADDEEEEPEGLIPNNYVQDAKPIASARGLYDYTRQTEEEVTFEEDAQLDVYDTADPDWTLVGIDGEFGFAPANYIELSGAPAARSPARAAQTSYPTPTSPAASGAAADLAAAMGARPSLPSRPSAQSQQRQAPPPQQLTPEESEEDEGPPPALPTRPPVAQPGPTMSWTREEPEPDYDSGMKSSPPNNRAAKKKKPVVETSGGFRLYNISEMMSVMGRRKKMPTTLGLNISTGVISLMPENSGSKQEWTSEKISHYSLEGKHVFLELVRPTKSLDLHAGTKDTGNEIVNYLGEIVGATRAEGIKEVAAAATPNYGPGQKKGVVLYDFVAQGDDEVTVAAGDDIVVLDDDKSEEWWNIRRLKNGAEGVMPASYVEVTGIYDPPPAARPTRSVVEQNRQEEERLTREAARRNREAEQAVTLPERDSSLGEESRKAHRKKSKSETKSKSKPDYAQVRTWTDRSGTFKVDAQFVGLADGKIHLHKVNGVRIAVPIAKMSQTDLDYVEKMKQKSEDADMQKAIGASLETSGAPKPKESDYDWFDFFLKAGVGPHQCERYAQAMQRDAMDESILSDINQGTLRTLGLKEGDALKVMKYLDGVYGRTKTPTAETNGEGGLFTGPGGALKTNRTRPEANRTTSDVVDANALTEKKEEAGFENDATWTVQKPRPAPPPPKAPSPAPVPVPKPSAALIDLSILHDPVAPTPAAPKQAPAPTGATPSFFDSVEASRNVVSPPPRPTSAPQYAQQGMNPQVTGVSRTATNQAPLGQSMDELTAHRMQQQYAQYLQAQQTGYGMFPSGIMPQPTGYGQPYLNGNAVGSPFADPRAFQPQPTGYGMAPGPVIPIMQPQKTGFGGPNGYGAGMQPQPTGFQPMYPQQTGYQPQMQPQPTGYQNGFGNYQQPTLPPMPQQPALQPLVTQKTGPAPQIRFGVEAKKLVSQPTGRRANLAAATPQNPFGF